jgi:hypothetical protein
MQNNQGALNQAASDDLRASNGEVVRRVDLDRAAGTPGRFHHEDPDVAGYEGVKLARAALAGDQAALDKFHALAGLALSGVTEHSDGDPVRLVLFRELPARQLLHQPPVRQCAEERVVFLATNEHRNGCTRIDATELIAWILSSEGREALARRGILVPILMPEKETVSPTTICTECNKPWSEHWGFNCDESYADRKFRPLLPGHYPNNRALFHADENS